MFRLNVGIIILNDQNQILLGERCDGQGNGLDQWQLPQGGIEAHESPFEAMIRELKEETGLESFELLKESEFWHEYEWPKGTKKKGDYRGQRQRYFLIRVPSHIEPTPTEEFAQFKWTTPEDILDRAYEIKRPVYEKVFKELLGALDFENR